MIVPRYIAVKGSLSRENKCFTCPQGPHRKEKLQVESILIIAIIKIPDLHLPRLKTLPIVNRAANFLDFTKIIGVNANAYAGNNRII